MPLFSEQLMRNTESQACRTATHIKSGILGNSPVITQDLLSAARVDDINEITNDFDIQKLKIFSSDGAIIHSTQNAKIGEINRHSYFWNLVAKGRVYSKIVQKNESSAEGKTLKLDVAEVYVPIMQGAPFLGALATLAENYDQDTGRHLARIQEYVGLLLHQLEKSSPYAHYMRQKDNYIANIQLASILHDIGKVAVEMKILLKPGRLTQEEFDQVKTHTAIATNVLAKANSVFVDDFGKDSYLAFARDIALHHHEKWDGSGYPNGLVGSDIFLSARVVALADVYDALRSLRPYKPARSHAFSVAEICRDKGSHFDPYVVDAFLAQAEEFDAVAASFSQGSLAESCVEQSNSSDAVAIPTA
jgi:response regulator RpfG family c-di-GMP phosphodiesterase